MFIQAPPQNRKFFFPFSTIFGSALATGIILGITAEPSAAIYVYNFTNITNNNAGDAAIGEAQLSMEVSSLNNNTQVQFKIYNANPASFVGSPQQSTVEGVYFGNVYNYLTQPTISGNPSGVNGVNFSAGGTPPNLPGSNNISPPFNTVAIFSANSPSPQNGINPGESLTLGFTLSGGSFQDVINTLNNSPNQGVGLKVQNFASGGSEAFVATPVPLETDALPLVGAAIFFGGGMWLKRRGRNVSLKLKDSTADNSTNNQ